MKYLASIKVEFDVENFGANIFYYLNNLMAGAGKMEYYKALTNKQRKDLNCAILKKALELAERE